MGFSPIKSCFSLPPSLCEVTSMFSSNFLRPPPTANSTTPPLPPKPPHRMFFQAKPLLKRFNGTIIHSLAYGCHASHNGLSLNSLMLSLLLTRRVFDDFLHRLLCSYNTLNHLRNDLLSNLRLNYSLLGVGVLVGSTSLGLVGRYGPCSKNPSDYCQSGVNDKIWKLNNELKARGFLFTQYTLMGIPPL